MTERSLDEFLELFIDSLRNIEAPYFRTVYQDMAFVIDLVDYEYQRRNLMRNIVGDDLIRTGERIFCYELYHQLRLRMGSMRNQFPNVYLQGELKKSQVYPIIEMMDLEPLNGNYIPDFLLHTPGSAEDHPYVIEVKVDSFLTYPQVTGDIRKLVEFLSLYRYQRGIFLTINTSDDFITHHFMTNETVPRIRNIHTYKDRIYVINMLTEHTRPTVRLLNTLI